MKLRLRVCSAVLTSTALLVPLALGCSGGDDATNDGAGGTTNGAGGSSAHADSNTNGSTGGSDSSGGSDNSGGAGNTVDSTTGGGSNSTGNSQTATTGISPIPGDPGCGLESAAFCDNFEAPSEVRGRAGELDPTFWSVSRGQPQLPTSNGLAFSAGAATLPACRSDLPAQVFPSDDSPICDPSELIHSNHLLVAVGAQNYGQNSYRIRQPFDFTD
ncbi:MAG TPA: hypothetical protein VFU02_16700, partial [Polyangiaceae bacterium]|nr:hypothetical protein [Polyangiaceae bacterium]